MARASARRETAEVDEAVLHHIAPEKTSAVRKVAHVLAPVGKWYTYLPTALAVAGYLLADGRDTGASRYGRRRRRSRTHRRERVVAASTVAAASGAALLLTKAFDRWLPQPPTPPGHENPRKPVFPSGHAFGTGAVGLTSAYLLAERGHARPGIALPIAAALPLVLGGARMLDERHWVSDVVGGYLGGIAIAATCLAGYEMLRE
jgi:membrane-associated phospholipid phosphatase